ncbi:hypothetical protein QQP08_001765 [Theobroma cacao]|nr:hypothetical protein QQP08_001765 [Theobroma cacao]
MLENPAPTAPDSAPAIKRYVPANQRNRSLGRRKSGDWFDSTNNVYGNDSEKSQAVTSRNYPVGDAGSSSFLNEDHPRPGLIALEGCSGSEASRLLSNRMLSTQPSYCFYRVLVCSNASFELSYIQLKGGARASFLGCVVGWGCWKQKRRLSGEGQGAFVGLSFNCHSLPPFATGWAAAMHRCHDTSIDLSERPVLYSGSSDSAWRNFRLPHQMMSSTNSIGPSPGSQMDFLGELRRAIRNANANSDN